MKILIVDDDAIMRLCLQTCLEKEGYVVALTSNAHEALGKIRDFNPSLIITDIKMPGISGLEMLTMFKGHLFDDVPVIIISTLSGYEVKFFANAIGADAYFEKPVKLKEVIKTIKGLVGVPVKA